MSALTAVLDQAFGAFNTRDLARLRPLIHQDAVWPNTLEDGPPLVGKEAVLGHFARVFATNSPNIQLIEVVEETAVALTVDAQYAVEGPNGAIWSDTRARLTYHFKDDRLSGMTIVDGF